MIKKYILTVFFIFLLAVIQATLIAHLRIMSAEPNIVLLFFIFVGIFAKPRSNFIYFLAVVSGLFLDFFSLIFGLHILVLVIMAIGVKKLALLIERKNVFSFIFLLFVSLLSYQFLITLLSVVFRGPYIPLGFANFIYNFVLGILFLSFYVFYKKKIKS